jgi:hypothetical protein
LVPVWTLKIASHLPPPPCLDVCSSSSKEAINKVGTGNIFPWRDTWILRCWHRLATFLELMIHSQWWAVVKEVITKDDIWF